MLLLKETVWAATRACETAGRSNAANNPTQEITRKKEIPTKIKRINFQLAPEPSETASAIGSVGNIGSFVIDQASSRVNWIWRRISWRWKLKRNLSASGFQFRSNALAHLVNGWRHSQSRWEHGFGIREMTYHGPINLSIWTLSTGLKIWRPLAASRLGETVRERKKMLAASLFNDFSILPPLGFEIRLFLTSGWPYIKKNVLVV